MPIFTLLANVQKELNGRQWSNTHYFNVVAATRLAAIQAFVTAGADESLLNFERHIHIAPIKFTKLYLGDAYENLNIPPGSDPSRFYVRDLNSLATRIAGDDAPSTIAPLNIAVLVKLQTLYTFAGNKFFKGMLLDSDVKAGGASGVQAETSGTLLALQGILNSALVNTDSGVAPFNTYVTANDTANINYVTVRTGVIPGTTQRAVVGTTDITLLVVKSVTARKQNRIARRRRAPRRTV